MNIDTHTLERVISGGQTGADQGGLAAARRFGIATGGWMPRGWLTADGPDPELAALYGLREHSGGYPERTAANVRDSDGTLRIAGTFHSYGERCTLRCLRTQGKPYFDIDMHAPPPPERVARWLLEMRIRVLNVAGNVEPRSRTAKSRGITRFTVEYLGRVFRLLGREELRPPVPGVVSETLSHERSCS